MKVILPLKLLLFLACNLAFQCLVLRLRATRKQFSADLFSFLQNYAR